MVPFVLLFGLPVAEVVGVVVDGVPSFVEGGAKHGFLVGLPFGAQDVPALEGVGVTEPSAPVPYVAAACGPGDMEEGLAVTACACR